MTDRLTQAALAAADLFRHGDTPDQSEIRELVRAADEQLSSRTAEVHQDDCLMCAVRALTEGDPAATWNPEREGATVSGVVLRQGELVHGFGRSPYVDLWLGGTGRVRVLAHSESLRHGLAGAAPQIGDRLQIWYDGNHETTVRGTGRPVTYKVFRAAVQRGH